VQPQRYHTRVTPSAKLARADNFGLDQPTGLWSADFYFEVTDHFGLDRHDAIAYQGYHSDFAAWWALQHRKGFKPFKTKITIFATIQGKI
jgi:Protein of unknown function (DUF3289)